jgi:hypothetical protein
MSTTITIDPTAASPGTPILTATQWEVANAAGRYQGLIYRYDGEFHALGSRHIDGQGYTTVLDASFATLGEAATAIMAAQK